MTFAAHTYPAYYHTRSAILRSTLLPLVALDCEGDSPLGNDAGTVRVQQVDDS